MKFVTFIGAGISALALSGCAVYPVGYEAAPAVVYGPAPVVVAPAPVYIPPPAVNFNFSYRRGFGGGYHHHGYGRRW